MYLNSCEDIRFSFKSKRSKNEGNKTLVTAALFNNQTNTNKINCNCKSGLQTNKEVRAADESFYCSGENIRGSITLMT